MTTMIDTMRQQLSFPLTHLLLAALLVFVGWMAGFFLGRAIARSIASPRLAGFASRLCILVGTIAALPLAAKIAQL